MRFQEFIPEQVQYQEDIDIEQQDLDEGTVDDLEKDLREPYSYDAIDHMMQTIARKNNITAKELHDQFVEKHGMTPDDWIKDQIKENFADGKKPGRKGLAKRMGVNCKQSVSKLRKIARNSSGERQRMAHWCANMKAGRKNEGRINEVQILSKVKGKGSEPSQLPKFGREIQPDQEQRYLGQQVGKLGRYQIWRDWLGGQLSYHLFDPRSRTVIVTTFGSQYRDNPNSYIIHGLYAAPGNPVKAHEFYHALIQDQGLTLISDRKQSPGGNQVWINLERYPDVEIYGYDTNTGKLLNFGPKDAEMYAVPSHAAQGRDSRYIANNIRLVATVR